MTAARLRILAVEPYYGGSHRAVLDGLAERYDADWTLLTLPARKWKWRMRGAAIAFSRRLREELSSSEHDSGGTGRPLYDLVFASSFVNLAELYGMAGPALSGVPSIVYFHENQLVYPNRHTAEWDYQFPLTNITSALCADVCAFNTEWNMRTFLEEIPAFIAAFPDHRPQGVAEAIAAKSVVVPPPFDPVPFDEVVTASSPGEGSQRRVRIVWPHRWEHDKDPEGFFEALKVLVATGLEFEVVIAGQAFAETRDAVLERAAFLGDRLVHAGEPESRDEYARLLCSSDIAVSTAINEFFGLAMIEACYAGCTPVVPDRLAYTDIYPDRFRYTGMDGLVGMLQSLIGRPPPRGAARRLAEGYSFECLLGRYGELFEKTAAGR